MSFKKKFIGLVFLLAFNLFVFPQELCDSVSCDKCICCSGIDPTPAGQTISHVHEQGEWMVSLRTMQMTMDGLANGTNKISKNQVLDQYKLAPDNMRMNMYMLMIMYGVNNRLTLMAMLDYNTNYMEMTMNAGKTVHRHGMQSQGIGDTKLTALYALIKKPTYHLLLSAGISIPSGDINFSGHTGDMMYPNSRYPYCMQNGSGSYEALPGLCYLVKLKRFTYSAQFASGIRLNTNALGYKLGNQYVLNTWLAYQLFPFLSSSIRIEGNQTDQIIGADSGLRNPNDITAIPHYYGGTGLNAFAGINMRAKKGSFNKVTLSLEYGLPVYQNLNGIQLLTKQFVNASLAFRF